MAPTNELRFIERETEFTFMDEFGYFQKRTIRVLQQKWVGAKEDSPGVFMPTEEWRDVPLVKEEA